MDIAVIAVERLGQGPDAGDIVPADVAQQLHPLAGEDSGESIPALKSKIALMKDFAALGAMPGIDEPARGFVFKRAADSVYRLLIYRLPGLIVPQVPNAGPGAPGSGHPADPVQFCGELKTDGRGSWYPALSR
jgi:hypothetical protein